jgi:hypothetical protein
LALGAELTIRLIKDQNEAGRSEFLGPAIDH